MTMPPPGGSPVEEPNVARSPRPLGKVLRVLSLFTMVMTVPQVLSVWRGGSVSGVSLVSWASYLLSACVWLVYGVRKRDKTRGSEAGQDPLPRVYRLDPA